MRYITTILSIFILATAFNLHSSPKKKTNPYYEVKEEKVYTVKIYVSSSEEASNLRKLGIKCKSSGKLIREITETEFKRLKKEGYPLAILNRAIKIEGKKKNTQTSKSRDYKYGENFSDITIPDDNGWVYSPITIYSAPSGATVTSIDVHYEIIHTYVGNLIVDLNDFDLTYEYRLWDREGGSQNNIYETEYGITTFNGEYVNQEWDLWAEDCAPGDSGYIDYWWIEVYYQAGEPDLIITDISPSNNQPWINDYINVTMTIKNQGTADISSSFWTDIFYNENAQPTPPATGDAYFSTSSLGAGESVSHTFYNITSSTPGMWHMYGLVDSWDDISESNENNNGYGHVNIFWKEHPQDDDYGWPISNFNVQHPLNGTFMEYRPGSPEHFHDGIDIHAPWHTPVYNVSAGPAYPSSHQIRVGNFNYAHLENIESFKWGDWVNSDTLLGQTDNLNHVHFSDGDDQMEVNPLRDYGIKPYLDTEPPTIFDVTLTRDGDLNNIISPNNVNGNIDIVVHARDDISSQGTPGPKAVYRIGYHIVGFHSGPIYNLQFDNWLSSGNLGYVYALGSGWTDENDHYYIVTNNMTSNNYWNSQEVPNGNYTLRITAQDIRSHNNGKLMNNTTIYNLSITVTSTGIEEHDNREVPLTFAILQNHPNPFTGLTEIKYQLPEECNVKLSVYNAIGEKVQTIIDRKQSAGYYKVYWDGKNELGEKVPAGNYFARLKAEDFKAAKKMILIK